MNGGAYASHGSDAKDGGGGPTGGGMGSGGRNAVGASEDDDGSTGYDAILITTQLDKEDKGNGNLSTANIAVGKVW